MMSHCPTAHHRRVVPSCWCDTVFLQIQTQPTDHVPLFYINTFSVKGFENHLCICGGEPIMKITGQHLYINFRDLLESCSSTAVALNEYAKFNLGN